MTSTGVAARDLRGRAFRQLIGGELVEGATTQPVIDPATEEVIATAPVASASQVDAAVAAAAGAFEAWRATPLADRAAVVRAIADAIEARREEIATIVTLENGKPIDNARGDVDDSLTWARHVADFVIEPEVLRDDEAARIEVHHRPVGVVAAIIPWNFPFFQTIYKLAPALLAGNTVVIKPAPTTPLNACLIAEIVQPLVPPGVVNVVGDAGEVGPQLTVHPDVAKVSFTGSTASGRKVMASGSPTLKKIVLELGGNDSAIVLADADVPAVAKDIFSWAFKNTGQVCINIKRIMVPGSLYEEFAEEFADLAKATKVGHGLDQDTELGPIQNSRQYEAVKTFLEKAHQDGTVIAGGSLIEGPGYFVQPTVLRDVAPESSLIHEEVFGPIRSLIRYEDVEEAIQQANDTHYGLGNSVWGTNVEEARRVAERLESGTVWVNTHFALQPDVPFGGWKQSGVGVEFGREGVLEFTRQQVMNVKKSA